jgi:ribosomal protein S18 acetylase RimI-like enzyme
MNPAITPFDNQQHRDQVISLWNEVFGYEAAHNLPQLVIDKKLEFGDGLFFVALNKHAVIGTAMAGYDGHRGWIYSIAVSPEYRKQGVGSSLLAFAEEKLLGLGCMKINLQIMDGNEAVEGFYLANGYLTEIRISMGKSLPNNISIPEK